MKTKRLTRQWSLMLLLMAMFVPSLAWAQPGININEDESSITIDGDVTITTDTHWSTYNKLYIDGTLTIDDGVVLTAPDNVKCYGTVNNYGTFEGTIMSNDGTVNNYGGTISFIFWDGTAYVDVVMNTHVWSEWTIFEAASTTQFGTDVRTCPGDDSHAAHNETRIRYKLHDASIVPTAYNGTPATPQRITADNYSDYGFTASNYQLYENWYAITSSEELFGYTSVCMNDGNNAILLNDIIINVDGDDTYTWTPEDLNYNTFDGAGHTIAGLKVDYTESFAGLFSSLDFSALVKNLGIINSTVTTTSYFAGGIAGKVFAGSTITNCYVMNVAVTTSALWVGGITGQNLGGTVSNCFAVATVNGGDANIIAPTLAGGTNTNCYGAATLAELGGAATGELCYKLNCETSDGTQAWYQAIGTDNYPVLSNTGSNTVYFGYADCTATEKSVYSNSADWENQGHIGNNGYCPRCGEEFPTADIFTLTDGVTYNRTTQCAATTLNYTRTFSNTTYNALYVPFAMQYSDWSDKADVYRLLNVFENDNDDNGTIDEWVLKVVKLKEGESTKANTPYLIKPKATGDMAITLSDVTLDKAEENSIWCASTDYKFEFTGTYAEKDIAADSYFFVSTTGGLQYAASDVTLKPQRWYMGIYNKDTDALVAPSTFNPAASPAKAITIISDDDNDITGITSVESNESGMMQNIYSISGQRLNAPVKGLNIINGKKIIVR